MKRILATLCVALSGCSTVGKLDNVLVVSLTGDRAFVASLYGGVGVTAELREQDARELKRMREQARNAEELVRMMMR